jgi:hypothetical protein
VASRDPRYHCRAQLRGFIRHRLARRGQIDLPDGSRGTKEQITRCTPRSPDGLSSCWDHMQGQRQMVHLYSFVPASPVLRQRSQKER